MTIQIYYDHHEDIARAFVVEDGKVKNCFFDRLSLPQETGSVYYATVDRVMPNDRGAFLKLDQSRIGFLNRADGLNSGDKLFVQIKSEAREGKASGVSKIISLPAVYLIYQPYENEIHFSRRVDGDQQNQGNNAIEHLLANRDGGWVVRRAAFGASQRAIESEIHQLESCMDGLEDAQVEGLVLPAPSALGQAILGEYGHGKVEIIVEEGTDYKSRLRYLNKALPDLCASFDISLQKNAFDNHDLNGFFDNLCRAEMALPDGGSLVFNTNNTLTSVDVNAGTGRNTLDINRTAAMKVMEQVRLRNIGGMIVVDFLKMKRREDEFLINDILRDLATHDTSPVDIFGFTRMGLCEMSRARRGYSLPELLGGV